MRANRLAIEEHKSQYDNWLRVTPALLGALVRLLRNAGNFISVEAE